MWKLNFEYNLRTKNKGIYIFNAWLVFFLTFQDSFKIIILKSVPKQLFFSSQDNYFCKQVVYNLQYELHTLQKSMELEDIF